MYRAYAAITKITLFGSAVARVRVRCAFFFMSISYNVKCGVINNNNRRRVVADSGPPRSRDRSGGREHPVPTARRWRRYSSAAAAASTVSRRDDHVVTCASTVRPSVRPDRPTSEIPVTVVVDCVPDIGW